MNTLKNQLLHGAEGRPFLVDVYSPNNPTTCPIVLFAHGFKGFKDWGHWHLIAKSFVEASYIFVTFNFSHNGTTIGQPSDFTDLDAFGQNNYSKELFDLNIILNWITNELAVLIPAEPAIRINSI